MTLICSGVNSETGENNNAYDDEFTNCMKATIVLGSYGLSHVFFSSVLFFKVALEF